MDDYYVYVYIDPRNFEEFYYGKGRGSRKEAHLKDASDSVKARRIADIVSDGQEPIIRVIARNLNEHDALLVEKTLLWKLGKGLSNVATGSYAENFRPDFKMHVPLSGFDFKNGVYYFNVGEGSTRLWIDCKTHCFISAGGSKLWRDSIMGFRKGDVLAAYLKGKGFVGIGRIIEAPRPIRHVTINGVPILNVGLESKGMVRDLESDEKCEYVALVDWIRAVDADEAKWKAKSGIYTTTHVRASLDGQPETLAFLEKEFDVDFKTMIQ